MATKPKAILSTMDNREASPITRASNVLFENGQTAQDILNDRQDAMISPVIENSSSMFKVGQGDNVDYSNNVVNGAYESMVLKGKTMVNCIQEPSSQDVVLPYEFEEGQYVTINDTKESGALGVELKGQTLVNLRTTGKATSPSSYDNETNIGELINTNPIIFTNDLSKIKYNTVYTVILEVTQVPVSTNVNRTLKIQLGSANTSIDFSTDELKNGVIAKTYTTPSSFDSDVRIHVRGTTTTSMIFKNLMIIEGDYTNIDIPYFEGMQSVRMPALMTTGKNLFDGKWEIGGIGNNNGLEAGGTSNVRSVNYINVEPNTTYKASSSQLQHANVVVWYAYDKDKNFISSSTTSNIFTTPSNCKFIRVRTFDSDSTNMSLDCVLQIEQGSIATSYEPYKSSILSLPEEVVLRSLPNGVCDTLNTRTGVYIQNCIELIYDGETNSGASISTSVAGTTENTNSFSLHLPSLGLDTAGGVCDCLKIVGLDDDEKGIVFGRGGAGNVFIKTDKTIATIAQLKEWLKNNNIRVVVRTTPIVTKINLPSTLKSWNTTTHIYSEIPENTLYPILSHSNPSYPVILKPSTKYSIVANSYSNDHTNSAINFNLGGATASTVVGNRVTTITTPSTLSNELLTMSGRGNKLNNVIVIEGDVAGDEPYFEGICDCKSPILSNVGKNLLDIKNATRRGSTKCNFINHLDGSVTLVGDGDGSGEGILTTTCYAHLKQGETYTFSFESDGQYSGINGSDTVEAFLLKDGSASIRVIRMNDFTTTFTCQDDGDYYVRFDVNKNNTTHKFWNIQLTEGATVYPYEPYKSNTTTFDQKDGKTIVLRSLPNGVCDTLNVETGEYIQRIGEVTKNNSTGFGLSRGGWENKSDVCTFEHFKPEGMKVQLANNKPTLNCDKVPSNTFSTQWNNNKGIESITQHDGGGIVLSITRDKLLTQDVNGLNTYLQSNPLTIQYELATPIVSTIDVQGFPYAYANGHVQLSSGSIEQSLTPKVEYSVATNRNGQIRSNQKMVERHQKQLDQLQAIILANLVNSQYNQTLTTLKYELSRV